MARPELSPYNSAMNHPNPFPDDPCYTAPSTPHNVLGMAILMAGYGGCMFGVGFGLAYWIWG